MAPVNVPDVMLPLPSKLRVPMKVAGEIMAAESLCMIETVYVPDRLAFE